MDTHNWLLSQNVFSSFKSKSHIYCDERLFAFNCLFKRPERYIERFVLKHLDSQKYVEELEIESNEFFPNLRRNRADELSENETVHVDRIYEIVRKRCWWIFLEGFNHHLKGDLLFWHETDLVTWIVCSRFSFI